VIGPTPGTLIRRGHVESLLASVRSCLLASAICSVRASIMASCRATYEGIASPTAWRTRAGKLSALPDRIDRTPPRIHPRTVLINLVRDCTSASRIPHIVLRSRDSVDATCTDGRSIRHDTSLSLRASRLSVFIPRSPTPRALTNVAATTRVS